jgi:anti-sigma B factor antagonist
LLPKQEGESMFNVRMSTREYGGYVAIALRGELDVANAADVEAGLMAAVSRESLIIVDLAGLRFIDASGVAALLRARAHARNAGGDLRLCAPRDQARRILGIIRPVDAFALHASTEEVAGRSLAPVAPLPLGPVVPLPRQSQAPRQLWA